MIAGILAALRGGTSPAELLFRIETLAQEKAALEAEVGRLRKALAKAKGETARARDGLWRKRRTR